MQVQSGHVRYAVVGLGYIAQAEVLPAFRQAKDNSELVSLVSGDPTKLRQLGRRYGVTRTYDYDEYEACLRSGEVDAVYIALPNHMHREFSVKAAEAGIHVLCEKPMAVTEAECRAMIDTAQRHGVKLMIAYRLHFEAANLHALETVRSGQLGEARIFHAFLTMQVKPGDIRLKQALGGGTLYDTGIYCINAARMLFRDEPLEGYAISVRGTQPRFREVDEMTSAVLHFPKQRLATFTCSFGAADVSAYELLGTKGRLRLDPAFEHLTGLKATVTIGGRVKTRAFPHRSQFAAELLYFSDCILTNREPEPSGREGSADVQIIQALYDSAARGTPVHFGTLAQDAPPVPEQAIRRPAVAHPDLVHAAGPSAR